MRPFSYARVVGFEGAAPLASERVRLVGGGNDLLDLAKRGVSTADVLLRMQQGPTFVGRTVWPPYNDAWLIRSFGDSESVWIGAQVTLAQIAGSWAELEGSCPALCDAARDAATPQIRNTATIAGNLLQRPRCAYFRDPFFDCLKRGGTSCPAREGVHDEMAIFGNAKCCATHPSNLGTALLAAGGAVHVVAAGGKDGGPKDRIIELDAFFVAPEKDVTRETQLQAAELVAGVRVLHAPVSAYVEINQKQSYDWASVACAVALDVDGDKIADARIALGAVAPVPLLSEPAAAALIGKGLRDTAAWDAAAAAATQGATPLARNGHKVRQLRAVVRRAIEAAVARSK